ncbi:zinc ribbon-containing protein [Thiotrichales bacterium HSG1]|nr:zinc ribbon-containing protein [Thiotrichales bacterium HSG1]
MKDQNLVPAYRKMLSRAEAADKKTLHKRIEMAVETAIELEELSREEAENIGDYLLRDLQDAAKFIVSTEQALVDWISFDLELIEERLLEMFSVMVDHSRLELDNLAERAHQAMEWHTGEITGLGTLYCANCSKPISFKKPNYIPACPNCESTLFKRILD